VLEYYIQYIMPPRGYKILLCVKFVPVHHKRGSRKLAPLIPNLGTRGGALVEALRYKPEGRGIDSRWCHWNFLLILSVLTHYGPWVDSASNRNDYQE
jgi:hypothetical protein